MSTSSPRAPTHMLLTLAAAAAVLAACRTERAEPSPDGAAPLPAAAAADWQQCTNERADAVVHFPADWQTNDGSVMPPCTLFDPRPITVPPYSEIPADIAVTLNVEEIPFERIAGSTFGVRVVSAEPQEIAGREGLRRLVEHTGEGLLDAGTRTWEYIVDWGAGRTLIAQSHDAGEPEFTVKQRTLDAMMARLQRN